MGKEWRQEMEREEEEEDRPVSKSDACEKSRLHDQHVKHYRRPVPAGKKLSLIERDGIGSRDTEEMRAGDKLLLLFFFLF